MTSLRLLKSSPAFTEVLFNSLRLVNDALFRVSLTVLKYLLDTDIVIYVVKNRPQLARERFTRHQGQMGISSVTLMELIYGAEKSTQPERNLRDIEGLCARLEVLPYDAVSAIHTGQIRAELAKHGTPVGPYDQMIAGHARSLGLILVSNNLREFQRIPGLRLENWINDQP